MKNYAIEIDLEGELLTAAELALTRLHELHQINYLRVHSQRPHIALLFGHFEKIEDAVNTMEMAAKAMFPFIVEGNGLGVYVRDNPVIYVRITPSQQMFALQQKLFELTSSLECEVDHFYQPLFWEAKSSLAVHDTSLGSLSFVLNSLHDLNFRNRFEATKLKLVSFSKENIEKYELTIKFGA